MLEKINTGKAAFIGPGIGREEKTRALLKRVLGELTVSSVIDANALMLIAEDKIAIPATPF